MADEFYVGYHERAPEGIRRRLRGVVIVLLVAAVGIAAAIATDQGSFRPSVFEFGVEREFIGWLSSDPVPSLFAKVPGHHEVEQTAAVCGGSYSIYPVTEAGTKLGLAEAARKWNGRLVRLRASLIYLDGGTMLDVVPDSIAPVGSESAGLDAQTEDLGQQTLIGEVIDSKCHLGLMDPSTGKVHRACAARCISGGIPPALHVEDEAGRVANLLWVGRDGRAINGEVLEWVGDAVQVTGRVVRHENLLVLYADPGDIERL